MKLNKQYLFNALVAIAEGYAVEGIEDRYVVVENPNWVESDIEKEDRNLVIDIWEAKQLLFGESNEDSV